MSRPKPICQELRTWLKNNLGKYCLAPLTTADSIALDAAVHVAQLWAYEDQRSDLAAAFGAVVKPMQISTRHLAYHAIAMVGEWHYRQTLWDASGLPELEQLPRCSGEPRDY